MKRVKKIAIVALTVIAVLTFCGYLFVKNQMSYNASKYIDPEFKEQISSDKMLNVEAMKEDLDYAVQIMKDVHPKSYRGLTDEQKSTITNAYKKVNRPLKAGEFYFVANEIICSFKDGHTNLRLDTNSRDKVINMPIIWINDGIYVLEDTEILKKGDKILSINQKQPNELLKELSKVIPAENDQWVKVMGSHYIVKESYLNYLGLIGDNEVSLQVQRKDEEFNSKIPLVPSYKTNITNEFHTGGDDSNWVTYTIDKESSLGIFKLDKCINDDKYKSELDKFFVDVYKNNIENIAVDVRNNSGGVSSVIGEFMRYLDIDKYKSFGGAIRYSEEASEQRGYGKKSGYKSFKNAIIKNEKVKDDKLVFDGNVYILTSPLTFSSGNWFAVTFRDNNIGTIIGEPTGNQPSSYGDVLRFQLPNSRYIFQVSHKKWVRPNTENDPEDTLTPNIIVYRKIEDILNNNDAQVEKLKEIINTEK